MHRVWTQSALLTTLVLGASVAGRLAQAQPPDKRAPTFEVASVKPNRSGFRTPGVFRFQPDGSLRVVNMPLRDIIRAAYRLQGDQMDRWPGWLSSEYFDIQAKASGSPGEDTRRAMLRSVLQSRFQLIAHLQTHRGPSFELLPTRTDGRTGAGLKRSSADCEALRAKLPLNPLLPPPNAPLIVCGIRSVPGRVFAMGVPIDSLASALTDIVGRPVIDRTRLSARFDLDVRYTPDPMPTRDALPPDSAPIDPHGPSIFTALREQLGLTLEKRTGPIETLVIDHVDRPTSD
jgi:uncharacterized protein (TIGR03435 family)